LPHWLLPASTPTWLFTRADHRITIRKTAARTLMISGGAAEECFEFESVAELIGFQIGFESHLLEGGWSLVAFSPAGRRRATQLLMRLLRRRG
jgi:hypothetical protein